MINVIMPVVDDLEEYRKFIDSIKTKDVHFYVGVREGVQFEASKNVEVHVFKGKPNKEEMINSLHSCQMHSGKILIVRRPLAEEEFNALANSRKDIATLKKNHNKFCATVRNFWIKLLKKLFAFTFFEDISAVMYGHNMFDLISVCSNLSMASRINKYVGVEIEEIETQQKSVQKDYSRKKNWLLLALWSLIFVGSIVGGVLTCVFTKVRAITVVAVIAWMFIALVLLFVEIINFTRAIAVGDLRFDSAEEIQVMKFEEKAETKTETVEVEVAEKSRKTRVANASTKTKTKTTSKSTKKSATSLKATKTTASKKRPAGTKSTKTSVKSPVKGQNKK